jgi:excisionase family DNA binding protein
MLKSRARVSGNGLGAFRTPQGVPSHSRGESIDPLERLLTARELSELLQLHAKTVERMARDGRLPSLRVLGRLRFRPSDIASWLAAREDRACHGS